MAREAYIIGSGLFLMMLGCSTSFYSTQVQCEEQSEAFPKFVTCLKSAVESGTIAEPGRGILDLRSSSDRKEPTPKVKLYLLRADQLSEQVQRGELSDLDARVALQQLYVELFEADGQTMKGSPNTTTRGNREGLSFMCRDAISRGDSGAITIFCK